MLGALKKLRLGISRCSVTIVFFGWIPAVGASALQSHQSITQAAEQFVLEQVKTGAEQVQVKVGRLDTRLRLHQCSHPLTVYLPPNGQVTRRTTVGVRCDGDIPWSLYIPVTLSIFDDVVVASRDLPRDSIITAADLRLEKQDISRLHRGYLQRLSDVIGKRLKRRVGRDKLIVPSKIEAADSIKRGAEVTILAQVGQVRVQMKGKALDNGAVGDMIRVRNVKSERELEARIVTGSTVEVDN